MMQLPSGNSFQKALSSLKNKKEDAFENRAARKQCRDAGLRAGCGKHLPVT